MTNCPTEDVLLDYAACRLEATRAMQLDAHATTCARCAEYCAAQMAVWQTLDDWKSAPVSEGFNRELWRRIDADEQTAWPGASVWNRMKEAASLRFWKSVAPLALAGLLMTTGYMLDHSMRKTAVPEAAVVVTASDADQIERALDDVQLLRQVDTASAGRAEPGVM